MTSETGGVNPLLSSNLFVGRDQELGKLARLLGQGRSALLIGGRRAGKTTLARRLSSENVGRTVAFTDVSGWDLTSEPSGLGALRGALESSPETAYDQASRS